MGNRRKGIDAVHRPQPPQFAPLPRPRAVGWRLLCGACGLALLGVASGCNSLGNSRLVKELQTENERLLSEFRGQRDRAAELEKANRLQAERLAESEKMLARLTQGVGSGRLSSLPPASSSGAAAGSLMNSTANLPSASPAGSGTSSDELRWQPRYDTPRK